MAHICCHSIDATGCDTTNWSYIEITITGNSADVGRDLAASTAEWATIPLIGDHDAPDLLLLDLPVEHPAVPDVEPLGALVAREHPEHRVAKATPGELV